MEKTLEFMIMNPGAHLMDFSTDSARPWIGVLRQFLSAVALNLRGRKSSFPKTSRAPYTTSQVVSNTRIPGSCATLRSGFGLLMSAATLLAGSGGKDDREGLQIPAADGDDRIA
jgi:hypothetical protein